MNFVGNRKGKHVHAVAQRYRNEESPGTVWVNRKLLSYLENPKGRTQSNSIENRYHFLEAPLTVSTFKSRTIGWVPAHNQALSSQRSNAKPTSHPVAIALKICISPVYRAMFLRDHCQKYSDKESARR